MRVIATVVAVAASLVLTSNLAQAGGDPRVTVASRQEQAQLKKLAQGIRESRLTVWACQDKLGVERTRATTSGWSLPPSFGYRVWALGHWRTLERSCQTRLDDRTIPYTNDWVTAVRLVQRIYPSTAEWLLYISGREGGHGGFVMNHQGSGAGGWMQFMASTFYAHNDEAFADARRRGFIIDARTNSWTHPLGQAITAGYMRFTGKDGCHWCL